MQAETAMISRATSHIFVWSSIGILNRCLQLWLAASFINLAFAPIVLAEANSAPPVDAAPVTLLRGSISLAEAQNLALKQNRDVLQAGVEISRNEAKLKSVIAERFPKITTLTFAGQQVNSGYYRNFATLPGVFQPVSQQYRLGLQVREAMAIVEISKQRFRRSKQRAVADVKTTYLSMLALKTSIESLTENLKFLRELERFVRSEVARGANLPVDVMLVQARTARADFELEKAKDDLEALSQNLNRLLGRPIRTEMILEPVASTSPAEPDANAPIESALSHRPELAEVRLDIRRSSLEHRVQNSLYIPDISVGVTAIFSHNLDITLPRSLVSTGFLATWEPWDWGRRLQLGLESKRKMRQDEIKLADLAEGVSIDADKARREVQVAKKEAIAGELGEIGFREQLRVVHRRYTAGAAVLKDVLEAQAAYSKAIADNVKAKIDIATAQVELDEATGRDF